MRRPALLALAACAVACGPATTSTPPPAVTGTASRIHWAEAGTSAPSAGDPDRLFIEAHVPTGSGWKVYPALVNDDASFRIEGLAPTGRYWLRMFDGNENIDRYVLTDATQLDLGRDKPGRAGVKVAENRETKLIVDATGMDPWQGVDETDFVVGNTGYCSAGVGTFYATNAPQPGDDQLKDVAFTWSGFPLAEAAKGDKGTFIHLRGQVDTASGIPFLGAIESAALDPYSQADGETTHATGTFSPGPELDLHANLARSQFAALKSSVGPTPLGDEPFSRFWVRANPGGAAHGALFDWNPRLLDNVQLPTGSDDVNATFPVHNPFPADWLYAWFEFDFHETVTAPHDETITSDVDAWLGVATNQLPDEAHPIVPLLSPAQHPTVGGKDLFTRQEGVGLTPTISWSAPAIGKPTSYEIHVVTGFIQRDFQPRPTTHLVLNDVAVLTVPGDVTSVTLPAEMLDKDGAYFLRIRAVAQAGQDVNVAPFRSAFPVAWADMYTAYFAP